MKRYAYILTALCLLTASGCIKDNTNSVFADIDLPVIDNPDKDPSLLVENHTYKVKHGELLTITPAISYHGTDDLSYMWVINGETVGTEKDLQWTCDLDTHAPGALYVTRASAGNSTIFRFYVELDQPYERGWLLAVSKGGKVSYSFLQEYVSSPYRYTEYPDALSTESTPDSWILSREFWSNESNSVVGHMLHLDADPAKSFSAEELTMVKTVDLAQEFINDELPEGVKFTDALYSGYVAYLVGDDGRLYYRKSQKGYYTGRFSSLPLKHEGEDLKVSAVVNAPYNTGICLVYDSVNERFLAIQNAFQSQNSSSAGTVVELPESPLDGFKGEKILYNVFLKPDYAYLGEWTLFLISQNGTTGVVSASEYKFEISTGNITNITETYSKAAIPGFGTNSKVTALESPTYGQGYVYYTDSDNPKKLYWVKRGRTGLSTPEVYNEFDAGIVAIDHGVISRTTKTIGVGLDNGNFMLLNLVYDMEGYTAPAGEETNSLTYEWKNVGDQLLGATFRYGKLALRNQ